MARCGVVAERLGNVAWERSGTSREALGFADAAGVECLAALTAGMRGREDGVRRRLQG